ncbi:MAG: hypothetical protein B7C24_12025 [Bacteroidetes bacterium 4572_77]|nr:MAG: hypothetical protein B7C24_12025 [Bacteroidetes bacterium 4572_77]
MKITSLIIALSLLISTTILAQDKATYEKHYYKSPQKVEEKNYSLSFSDIVSKMDYAKMAVEIKNLSNDYLMFNSQESQFIFDFGKLNSKKGSMYILPHSSLDETLKVSGSDQFLTDQYTLLFKGLYTISAQGEIQEMDEFQLPASKNNIAAGNFKISLLKTSQKTKETYAKFECEYIGDDIAIIDASKITVRVEGKDIVYANSIKKSTGNLLKKGGPIFLKKGEKANFKAVFNIPGKIADMQFSVLHIIWGDTFMESKALEIPAKELPIILDLGTTHGKN